MPNGINTNSVFFLFHFMSQFIFYVFWTLFYPRGDCNITNFVFLQLFNIHHNRFRRGFKQFFFWCPFIHIPHETLTRREVVTSRYSCSGSPDHRIIRNGKKILCCFFYFGFKKKEEKVKKKKKKKVKRFSQFTFYVTHTDTERSFLYTCPGSPKGSARKSHGKFILMLNFKKLFYL